MRGGGKNWDLEGKGDEQRGQANAMKKQAGNGNKGRATSKDCRRQKGLNGESAQSLRKALGSCLTKSPRWCGGQQQ